VRAIAIGSFDGIHPGHAAVVRTALGIDPEACVVCFEPVPRQFFGGQKWHRRLTTASERRIALSDIGVSSLLTLPFDGETVKMSAEEFLTMLTKRLEFDVIVAGYDFHFGAGRSGSCDSLRKWCTSMGYNAIIEAPLSIGDEPVKSERIRRLLETGSLSGCRRLLGRRYSVTGVVSRGKSVGRELGFPTLNLSIPSCKMLPPPGSYAGWVDLERVGRGIPAAVYVPPHATGPVEAHLLRPLEETYGRSSTVTFVKKLRDVAHVDGREQLSLLIAGIVRSAGKVLESEEK